MSAPLRDEQADHECRRESGTLTVLPDVDLYIELQDILQKIQSSATTSESYSLVFTYQPVAKASVKEGNSLNVSPVSQACKFDQFFCCAKHC